MPWNNYPKNTDTLYMTITSKGRPKVIDVNAVLGKASPSPVDKEILLIETQNLRLSSTQLNQVSIT